MLQESTGFCTTREISPGTETPGADGLLIIRDRVFTDVVECSDPRIAGVNRLRIALDVDTKDGSGRIRGPFELTVDAGGSWKGEVIGEIVAGKVRSIGMAVGTGPLTGKVLHATFQQVDAHPGTLPCPEPKAFFQMQGHVLSPE